MEGSGYGLLLATIAVFPDEWRRTVIKILEP
jgi:hypothetical protein